MTLRSRLLAHCPEAEIWYKPGSERPEWVRRFEEFGDFMKHAFEKSHFANIPIPDVRISKVQSPFVYLCDSETKLEA